MVEVFKTNVQETEQANHLIEKLCAGFPEYKVNFDLEDCDKILRVEGNEVAVEKVINAITINGFACEVLV